MKALHTVVLLLAVLILSACGGKGRGVITLSSASSSVVSSVSSSSSSSLVSSSSSLSSSSMSSSSPMPITAPQNLMLTPGDTQIKVVWDPVLDASYNLYYATESFSAIANINDYASLAGAGMVANLMEASHDLTGLNNETLYYLVVTFVVDEESDMSEMQSAIPMPPVAAVITGKLNDTGILDCSDYAYTGSSVETGIDYSNRGNNNLNCLAVGATVSTEGVDNDGDVVPVGQDALYGRDLTVNDNSDGFAGFSFTQLGSTGIAFDIKSTNYRDNPWSCVQDQVTGLVWEVKTLDELQDYNATYSWHNSTGVNDGGAVGSPGGDGCFIGGECDTEKYVAAINAIKLCGADDWRLPTKTELLSIVNYQTAAPIIDIEYFPNTHSSYYWTSTPVAGVDSEAFSIYFRYGTVGVLAKSNASYVRLVHGAKEPLL